MTSNLLSMTKATEPGVDATKHSFIVNDTPAKWLEGL